MVRIRFMDGSQMLVAEDFDTVANALASGCGKLTSLIDGWVGITPHNVRFFSTEPGFDADADG